MRFRYITPLLITISLLFSAKNAWSCITDGNLPTEEDLQYPSAQMISFKAVITKISSLSGLDWGEPPGGFQPEYLHGGFQLGKPHGGFQLSLKITNVYQGANLGNTIMIDYGGCHNLPGKQGDEINVLALSNKKGGWYAPQFWERSNKPIKKREWYQWW